MRFVSEILIILILTHLLRTEILIHLKIYSVYLTQILLYNCGYRFLLLSLINMLHIALKELKLDSIITGLPVKLNFN